MRIVLIVSDTFRYDHLGVNGNDWIRTPDLEEFGRPRAERAADY